MEGVESDTKPSMYMADSGHFTQQRGGVDVGEDRGLTNTSLSLYYFYLLRQDFIIYPWSALLTIAWNSQSPTPSVSYELGL